RTCADAAIRQAVHQVGGGNRALFQGMQKESVSPWILNLAFPSKRAGHYRPHSSGRVAGMSKHSKNAHPARPHQLPKTGFSVAMLSSLERSTLLTTGWDLLTSGYC